MQIFLDVFPLVAVLSLFGSLALFLYLFTTERRAPRFEYNPQNRGQVKGPKVSVIVTARNEEEMIRSCLESLLEQSYPNIEILVVDDSSTDRTAEIVTMLSKDNPLLRLVSAGPKPEGWVGKSWPCWRGFLETTGEYLLFVDADSKFEKTVVEHSILYAVQNSFDIFSLSPRVTFHGVWAKAVLPLITGAINLLYPMTKVNDRNSKRAYVFGTYFLIRRIVYEKTGGHSKVRNEIVEDAAVGRLVKSAGYSLRIETGTNFLSTEWESDGNAIFNGLERVVSSSIKSYGMISVINAVLLFFLVVYPVIYLVAVLALHSFSTFFTVGLVAALLDVGAFASLAALETKTMTGKGGGPGALLYFLGALIFIAAIVTTSVKVTRGNKIYWKGQGYEQGLQITKSSF